MWTLLTPETLLSRLSGQEAARLRTAALGTGQTDALTEIAALVANEWRGGLRRVIQQHIEGDFVQRALITERPEEAHHLIREMKR